MAADFKLTRIEYQAVIMAAGKGSRMAELTSARPKCLLPVANYPLIWYSLFYLEKNGFYDVIVIAPESAQNEIAEMPKKYSLNLKLDIVPLANDESGTADSLRMISNSIKTDIIVLACDLITNVPLQDVVRYHRIHGASVTAVFAKQKEELSKISVPGPKTKHKYENDLVGIDLSTSRLLLLGSEADFEEALTLKKSILKKFPRVSVYSKLMDAHLYILKKWVCEYLGHEKKYSTLKGELLPHIIRKQFSKPHTVEKDVPDNQHSVISDSPHTDIFTFAKEDPGILKIRELSFWNDHVGDLSDVYHGDQIRCYAHVIEDKFCMRSNTLPGYCELNRQLSKDWSSIFPDMPASPVIHLNAIVHSTQVGTDCLIGDRSNVADKTSIKRTIIGQNCRIEQKVRLNGCIIMDNVTIKEGASLQGCVVCAKVCVGEFCDLKDCLIGEGHDVHSGFRCSNEILVDMDRLMAF